MLIIKLYFVFASLSFAFAKSDEYFLIIGPRSVHHRDDYVALLTSTHFSKPTTLEVSLVTQDTKKLIETKYIELPVESQEVRFRLKSQESIENFVMNAVIPETAVSQSAIIYCTKRKYSVIIQTNKPVYQPGDLVQFHVLVIDKDTKPYQFMKAAIALTDGNKNKVKFMEIPITKTGVYQSSLQLSDDAVVGKWGIHVRIGSDSEIKTKNFEVREYTRPRFEAVIDTESAISLVDEILNVTVFGRYTFGGLVEGKALVMVEVFEGNVEEKTPTHKFNREINVKSKETLSFNVLNDLKIVQNDDKKSFSVKVTLDLFENLTNATMTTAKIVRLNANFNKEIFNSIQLHGDSKFKPGLSYHLKAIFSDRNGEIIRNSSKSVQVVVLYYNNPKNNCSLDFKKDTFEVGFHDHFNFDIKNGAAEISIPTYTENNAINIQIYYNNLLETMNVFRQKSRSREYIEVTVSRNGFSLDDGISVTVNASHEFNNLYALVIGRSGVIYSEVHNGSDRTSMEFSILPKPEMIPQATLFVFYYQKTGEIIFDNVTLSFERRFPNQMEINIPNENQIPGANTTMTLKTSPKSTILLSAVDSSVKFMRSDENNLRQTLLKDFMQSSKFPVVENVKNARYPEFLESNTMIITNAVKGFPDCFSSRTNDRGSRKIVDLKEVSEVDTDEARKDFPETWLFENFEMKGNSMDVTRKLPDSVTTWEISGMSLSPELGLGFSTTKRLQVLKPFFVQVEMPEKLILGEIAKVNVFVHNQKKNSRKERANVKLEIDYNDFEILEMNENCVPQDVHGNSVKKILELAFDSSGLITYFIRPISSGDLKVKIKASSVIGSDKVEKTVSVRFESASHYITKSLLVDMRDKKFYSFYSQSKFDANLIVPGSIKVGATAQGNVLGSALKLKSDRSGVMKFLWNLNHLKYLYSMNKLTDEKKAELVAELSVGYQDLMKMRLPDGSFGNVYLTALSAKILAHVKEWIEIDPSYTADALNFLDKKQNTNGGFEYGSNTFALTTFTTIFFLENKNYAKKYESAIKTAIDFIHSHTKNFTNNYEVATFAYVLFLSDDPHKNQFLESLKRNAIIEDDEMHWPLLFNKRRSEDFSRVTTKIEIASFALLANLKAENFDDSKKILKWILKHKNEFMNVEESIVLQALTEAGKTFNSNEFQLNIYLEDDYDKKTEIRIDNENQFVPVLVEIPSNTSSVSVMANGTGIAVLEIWWKFNLKTEKIKKNFEISVREMKSSENLMIMTVCASFIKDNEQSESELAVMEIAFPSGFVFSEESKKTLEVANIKRFETRENKSVLLIYVEKFGGHPICIRDIMAIKKHEVKQLKKSSIKMYDYHFQHKFGLEYYELGNRDSQEC